MAALTNSLALSTRLARISKTRQQRVVARSAPKFAVKAAAADAAADVAPKAPKESWYPGSPGPEYLDGSLPGDYGFDPLGLGSDPKLLAWFVQAELMHCRWAMVGSVGILVPEVLTKAGVADLPVWFSAGQEVDTFTDGLTLFYMQMLLMNWVEVRRWMDIRNPGSVSEDPIFKGQGFKCTGTEVGYPGGRWFNPLSMGATEDDLAELKQKEIKNGRLAMLAMVGFGTQAFATGAGPIENYIAHLSNPDHATMFN